MDKTPSFRDKSKEKSADNKNHAKRKTDDISETDKNDKKLDLADIIDIEEIQSLMNDFYQLTNIGIGILDLNGKVLVATGWQDICTKFHRAHPITLKHCIESNTELSHGPESGIFKYYHCKNNMWDISTPIIVEGSHIGNLLLGQFFFDDEDLPYETFRQQAQKYDFNEKEYIEALEKVPRWNRETINTVMAFYSKLTHLISKLAYSNIRLATILEEKNGLFNSLCESEERFRNYIEQAPEGIFVTDEDGKIIEANKEASKMTGCSKDELLKMNRIELTASQDHDKLLFNFEKASETGNAAEDVHVITKDGEEKIWTVKTVKLTNGKYIEFVHDITEQKIAEMEREITIKLLNLFNTSSELSEIITAVIELLKNWSGCEAVGIRLKDGDDYPYYRTRGFPASFVIMERSLCSYDINEQILRDELGHPILECMCGNVICERFDPQLPFFSQKGSFWTNSTSKLLATTTERDRQARTRNRCNSEGYESVALIPLRASRTTFGLIQLNDHRKGLFTEKNIALFERLADSVALALAQRQAKKRLEESEKLHKLQAEKNKTIIDTLPDMLFVIDREGYVKEYYSGEKSQPAVPVENIIGTNIKEVFPAEEASRYIEICNKCIDSGELQTIEYHLSNKGKKSFYEARLSPLYDNQVLAIIRDITESKNFRDTLTTIAETGFEHGENIFRTLVRQLAISQEIGTAFLVEYCSEGEKEKACTVAVWNHGDYTEDFDFKIKGTLCEKVISNEEWFCPSNVQQYFPKSQKLRKLRAESYWGISLKNNTNDIIGILAIIDEKPMERSEHLYSILSSFAARAAAEMERRKIEEALKENERKFRSYVDNSPSAIIVADGTGQYIDVNPAASKITGYSREELLSMNQKDTFPPEDKCNYDKLFAELYEKEYLSVELPFVKKDRTRGYWSLDIVALSENLYLGVHTDISDRINAEEMLGSATQRLTLATKSAGIGIWEWDLKTNSIIWDRKMHGIYGTDPSEFTGEFKYWVKRLHPDDIDKVQKKLNAAVSGIQDIKTEYRIITPKGEIRFLETHAMVKRDPDGAPLKVIGTNWDITERKMAEEALIYSKIISEDTNRIKSQFMNNVSHELRTPLTAVIGFSDVLLQQDHEGLSDEQKKYIEYINTSGKNLLDLINKLIDFSRYEITDLENLNVKKITLDVLINEIIMLTSKKATDKNINLSFKRKEAIETFYADEDKLTQIIHNLLENAVKFTDQGGAVSIETSTSGHMLQISVTDTGIGIDKDNIDTIFKPFIQIDGSMARKYNGTGIGLALTKKFIELHGGNIQVTSKPEIGSNFTFEIPIDPYLTN
ncbi:MAG: hypothetical protein PWQ63_929 [Methanolobus sp.]|jgi:PAS domain S-box-containing protein|nr:hypothetical protein [Methanolobus sp.]